MEHIALPSKIEITSNKEVANEAKISIQPCHPGYGITLGNALRRVILSSLPGSAIIAFKIKGASHEFTTVDNVKEDVVEISLNLKQLRFICHSDQPVRVTLKTKGQKVATAGDIEKNSEVEVVDPSQVIATLTDKNAELEMDFIIQKGRGYAPVETMDKENLEVGMIAIDAIFTPIKNVAFTTENVRVGDITNYENLILTVETDGSISPADSLKQATEILLDHFNFINQNVDGKSLGQATSNGKIDEEIEMTEIEDNEEQQSDEEEKPKRRGRPKKEEKE